MSENWIGPLKFRAEAENWAMLNPFRISGYVFESLRVVCVTVERDGCIGQGEAAGVYYRNDNVPAILEQLKPLQEIFETGISRDTLQTLLPAGGARNAVDCALWDLEARLTGRPAWRIAGLPVPRSLVTTFTCGADEPEKMAATAVGYTGAKAIKLKLTGDAVDADRVRAVRDAKPNVWLGVDANQGFTRASLERLMPVLTSARVSLIEQPFPIGQEALLDGFQSPIPLAADETVQTLSDISKLPGRFSVVNIKLDKCGGLTEGLAMARAARSAGLETMVGNMGGTSLAMASSFLVGQLCSLVDLDGPVFLKSDRTHTVQYENGAITCPESVWGGTASHGT